MLLSITSQKAGWQGDVGLRRRMKKVIDHSLAPEAISDSF